MAISESFSPSLVAIAGLDKGDQPQRMNKDVPPDIMGVKLDPLLAMDVDNVSIASSMPDLIDVEEVQEEGEIKESKLPPQTSPSLSTFSSVINKLPKVFLTSTRPDPSMGPVRTQHWFPDSGGDHELERRFQECFNTSLTYGHTELPQLLALPQLEKGEVYAPNLPWARFNAQTWETLVEAYALADLRCPVMGCEDKHKFGKDQKPVLTTREDFPEPVGTYFGPERDNKGFFRGLGLCTGLGTNSKPNSVKINLHHFIRHWVTFHMKAGLAMILPCPITEGEEGQVSNHKCSHVTCNGSRALLTHLTAEHGEDELRKFLNKFSLSKGRGEGDTREAHVRRTLAEPVRQWLLQHYGRAVGDSQGPNSPDNLDLCYTLSNHVVGAIMRREWRWRGGNSSYPDPKDLVTTMESWVEENAGKYKKACAYRTTYQSLVTKCDRVLTFPSRRDGLVEENFLPKKTGSRKKEVRVDDPIASRKAIVQDMNTGWKEMTTKDPTLVRPVQKSRKEAATPGPRSQRDPRGGVVARTLKESTKGTQPRVEQGSERGRKERDQGDWQKRARRDYSREDIPAKWPKESPKTPCPSTATPPPEIL